MRELRKAALPHTGELREVRARCNPDRSVDRF
jgi:hypothetical protein